MDAAVSTRPAYGAKRCTHCSKCDIGARLLEPVGGARRSVAPGIHPRQVGRVAARSRHEHERRTKPAARFAELVARAAPVSRSHICAVRASFWSMQIARESGRAGAAARDGGCRRGRASRGFARRATGQVLDLGTGSGAIALALARERRIARSRRPMSPAPRSRSRVATLRRAAISEYCRVSRCGDGTSPSQDECFHLIAANPPYVADASPGVSTTTMLRYEPRLATSPAARRHARSAAPSSPGAPARLEQRRDDRASRHGYDQRER